MDECARMNKLIVLLSVAVGLGAAAIFLTREDSAGTRDIVQMAELDIAQGELLYASSCAACHGVNLEGQPDWRSKGPDGRLPAPPHNEDGHTWHHGDGLLFKYTKLGGQATLAESGVDYDSGMPAFGDTLTDADILNILGYIKSTWTDRMRETQAERTEGEKLNGT